MFKYKSEDYKIDNLFKNEVIFLVEKLKNVLII